MIQHNVQLSQYVSVKYTLRNTFFSPSLDAINWLTMACMSSLSPRTSHLLVPRPDIVELMLSPTLNFLFFFLSRKYWICSRRVRQTYLWTLSCIQPVLWTWSTTVPPSHLAEDDVSSLTQYYLAGGRYTLANYTFSHTFSLKRNDTLLSIMGVGSFPHNLA